MSRFARFARPWLWALVACAFAASEAHAQIVRQAVGGVSIDAHGVASKLRTDELNALRAQRQQAMQPVADDLQAKALRKISLKRLEAAIADYRQKGTPLGDEMRYLAGMQRVQYVFVYPEQNDIVLAGPGEGWKVNALGDVVGVTTNRPVLLLDDLLVALRSIDASRAAGITCSIDPTSEGLARLQNLVKRLPGGDDIQTSLTAIEQTLGPQTITVGGVPASSHFAQVLVAADYRMKRLAMAFEDAPIAGLPSFMQMLKSSGKPPKTMLPRWWLAPDYDALVADAEGLAFEVPAGSVKAMTEEEYINAAGERQRSGKANPLAKKWADNMTSHYDELSQHEAVFGQLQSCMNLAVVAALISQQQLTDKCGWSMPLLMNPQLATESYQPAHSVDSAATAVQKGATWIISASGGVQINPWSPLEKPTQNAALTDVRGKNAAAGNRWWWN